MYSLDKQKMTDKASIIAGMKPMRSNIPLLIEQLKSKSRFPIKTANAQHIMNCAVEELQLLKEENEKLKKEIDEFEEDFNPLHDYMSGMTGVCNCKDVVDYIERLKEENKQVEVLDRIIGENWGEIFKEAFELVRGLEELIECGFLTKEDFE